MNKRKICIIHCVAALLFTMGLSFSVSFAWLAAVRNDVYIVTGDAHISVTYAGYIVTDITGDNADNLEYTPLNATEINAFGTDEDTSLSPSQRLIFRFAIKNESTEADARLKVAFSDFSSYLFEQQFDDFLDDNRTTMVNNAKKNNAKLTFTINDAYCYTEPANPDDPIPKKNDLLINGDGYLWNYAERNPVFSKITSVIDGITTNSDIVIVKNTTLIVCFSLVNSQSTDTLDNYHEWLCGVDELSSSAGRIGCAAAKGYTWEAVYNGVSSTNITATQINDYLVAVYNAEIDSLKVIGDTLPQFKLDISFIEFIGENLPNNN